MQRIDHDGAAASRGRLLHYKPRVSVENSRPPIVVTLILSMYMSRACIMCTTPGGKTGFYIASRWFPASTTVCHVLEALVASFT